MSFPVTLTPSSPAGLDSPRLGDDEIRNLKSLLADLFTLPVSPSTISATIGSVSTGGKLTITNGVWTGDVVGRAYGGTGLSVAGTSGNLLTSDGTNWTSAAPPVVNHAILSATHTDSTAAAVVRGDLMVGIGVTPKWERVAKGAEGTIVRAGATEPAYTTATYPATTTINQLLYSSAASVITGLATGNSGLLVTDGTGVPSIGTDIPTAVTIGGAYAYRANGTDVAVADGGTSLSTIADAAILATNSANVLTAVVAGASQSIRRNAGNTAWEAFTPGAGAGTVTSVAQSFTGGLISVAGSPVTTSGTLALTVAGTSGGIPYFSGATTWASSGALTANALVLGGGAGAAPAPMGSLGTTTTLLHGNAAGAPTFGAVSLTADVTGILPTANGGTNIAYFTAAGPTAARVYTFPDAAATINTAGLQEVWIDAASMVPRITNGPSRGFTEQTTNKNNHETLDFDTTTQEFAQFKWRMPKSWNLSTVTFIPIWTAASGSGGVVFGLAGVATSNNDALDVAFGTAQTSTDTLLTASYEHEGPASSAITIAGTPAASDMVTFQINRTVADGGDTLAVDAKLMGVILQIATNAANDA